MNHTNKARRYVTPNMDKTVHVVRNCTSQVPAPNSVMNDEATGVTVALPSNFQMHAASDLTGSTESAASLHISSISQTGVVLANKNGGFRPSRGSLSCARLCALFAPVVRHEIEFSVQAQVSGTFSSPVRNGLAAAVHFNSFVRA